MSKKAVDIVFTIFFSILGLFFAAALTFGVMHEFTTWGEVQYTQCDQIKDTNLYVCEKIK